MFQFVHPIRSWAKAWYANHALKRYPKASLGTTHTIRRKDCSSPFIIDALRRSPAKGTLSLSFPRGKVTPRPCSVENEIYYIASYHHRHTNAYSCGRAKRPSGRVITVVEGDTPERSRATHAQPSCQCDSYKKLIHEYIH